MPAPKLRCQWCRKQFYACRSDSKWCSVRCRGRSRAEDAKFAVPVIPESGHTGITFNRLRKRWEVRLHKKYLGLFDSVEEALKFQQEVRG